VTLYCFITKFIPDESLLIEYTDTMMELPRPQSLAIKLGKKRKYLMRKNEKTQKENEQLE
jgi:hypothetical protein